MILILISIEILAFNDTKDEAAKANSIENRIYVNMIQSPLVVMGKILTSMIIETGLKFIPRIMKLAI